MTGLVWGALGGIVTFVVMAALGDMVSEEVRDRLDHLPHAILCLAAMRLDPEQRTTIYDDEWLAELTYILKGDEARPVTRLCHGIRFAIGILASARRIGRNLPQPDGGSADLLIYVKPHWRRHRGKIVKVSGYYIPNHAPAQLPPN